MSILVNNLRKEYKGKVAVESASFTLCKGKPLAIVGRNGAGKSTIIKMLIGILKPTNGEIKGMNGVNIGYLPEERGLYPEVTVQDHLFFFANLLKIRNKEDTISYWLDRFELQHYKKIKIKDLSKGNAQKVQLAITLLNTPQLVILDEPLSGLDPINIKLIRNIINDDLKDSYVVMSSHQMDFIESICSEVMILNSGKLLVYGSIEEVKQTLGYRKMILPKNYRELISSEYEYEINDHNIELKKINKFEDIESVFSILKKEKSIPFISYEFSSLEDIFISLTNGVDN
ncbi:TPA: ABC transporter ATP-binding protein [Enterococcus faecalis]